MTLYFWRKNIIGMHESSQKALRIMQLTTIMVVVLIVWCLATIFLRGSQPVPLPTRQHPLWPDALGWLQGSWPHSFTAIMVLVGLGHSVLAMSGEETMAQVNREIAHPKLKNLERAGFVIFIYWLLFTSLVSFFAVMLIPDADRGQYLDNLIGGLAMYLAGPAGRGSLPCFRGGGGHVHAFGRCQHRHRRLERRHEPRGRRRGAAGLVPSPASPVRHHQPDHQPDRSAANRDHRHQQGRRLDAG